jgi:hypothetical protein
MCVLPGKAIAQLIIPLAHITHTIRTCIARLIAVVGVAAPPRCCCCCCAAVSLPLPLAAA